MESREIRQFAEKRVKVYSSDLEDYTELGGPVAETLQVT